MKDDDEKKADVMGVALDASTAGILQQVVQSLGRRMETVGDCDIGAPRLVVADLDRLGEDFHLLREKCRHVGRKGAAIVVLSEIVEVEEIMRWLGQEGVEEYVVKPVWEELLKAKIKYLLRVSV